MIAFLPYWRNETSGKLANAVEMFLDEDSHFTEVERNLLATYLRIWAFYPGWDYPGKVEALQASFEPLVQRGNRETIWQWLNQAMEIGIDPL